MAGLTIAMVALKLVYRNSTMPINLILASKYCDQHGLTAENPQSDQILKIGYNNW